MPTYLRFVVAVVVMTSVALACGTNAPASRGSAVVTLDVFSGMPNPTWALTTEQAADLLMKWDDLDETGAIEYSGYLGYRGVIVDFADGSRIWVSQGVAVDERNATARADRDGTLESLIVNTGRATLDPELLSEILSTIAQG